VAVNAAAPKTNCLRIKMGCPDREEESVDPARKIGSARFIVCWVANAGELFYERRRTDSVSVVPIKPGLPLWAGQGKSPEAFPLGQA
jgi:hypothetical protein